MSTSNYTINKGINRSIEFKGLRAQYIGWLAVGVIILTICYAIAFMLGVNAYLCLAIAFGLGTALVMATFRLSRRYGEYGLMKRLARRATPKYIRSRSRKVFTGLNQHDGKDIHR